VVNKYWSDLVNRLEPYVPGEQPKQAALVKLNTNENPYGPSAKVIEAIREQAGDNLRLYPPPESDQLRRAIGDYYGVGIDEVFVGNGSDEVLAHCFQALLKHKKPVLFPDITYSFYPVYCGLYGIEYQTLPLTADFSIRVADYVGDNGGIIFPNPNAPTGCLLPLADIEWLLQKNTESVVVVDEAYIDFGGTTSVGLVNAYHNLLVTQTLSKSRSLAGLRVGLAIGNSRLIEALNRVKNSFNSYPLDSLAIAGAVAAFADEEHFESTRSAIIRDRELLGTQLAERGFHVLPSAANFLFVRHLSMPGSALSAGLRQKGVLVRHFNRPRIENYLRITVGNPEQNRALVQALDQILV